MIQTGSPGERNYLGGIWGLIHAHKVQFFDSMWSIFGEIYNGVILLMYESNAYVKFHTGLASIDLAK